jgi:acetyl-CoA carboxylase biotin carboxyl carrier protein
MAKKTKPDAGVSKARGVDLEEIERVLQFMEKHRLEQFEYERDGVHIVLKKAATRGRVDLRSEPVSSAAPRLARAPIEEAMAVPADPGEAAPAAAAPRPPEEGLHVVKSPIVGTFYASPSPGVEAFVTVGKRVEAGQVLCIIEAMKLMNEIEADVAGEIARIFVENGHPVEYGERLFAIRTEGKK